MSREPMTDEELETVRISIVGHEQCFPPCDRIEPARLLATVNAREERAAREALQKGAEAMRAACSSMLRGVALQARTTGGIVGVIGAVASDYADVIDTLPLPGGVADAKAMLSTTEMSPAIGACGVMLYKDERVMVCRVTLEPGAEWPMETHADDSETVATIHGSIIVDSAAWVAFPDGYAVNTPKARGISVAFIPAKAHHTIRNASATERAQYISVLRRA